VRRNKADYPRRRPFNPQNERLVQIRVRGSKSLKLILFDEVPLDKGSSLKNILGYSSSSGFVLFTAAWIKLNDSSYELF
jgi:hypothetical protein